MATLLIAFAVQTKEIFIMSKTDDKSKQQSADESKDSKEKKSKSKKSSTSKKKKQRIKYSLSLTSVTRSLSLKFYAEELMDSVLRAKYISAGLNKEVTPNQLDNYSKISRDEWSDNATTQTIENRVVEAFKQRIVDLGDKDDSWYIFAIYHNKDQVKNENDYFDISVKKGHFHVLIWKRDSKRFRVSSVMSKLGLHYIKADSDMIWNHGSEVIHNRPAMVTYLTHETDEAEDQGKHLYDEDELIMTRSAKSVYSSLRADYDKIRKSIKKDDAAWDHLEIEAEKLGSKLGNYRVWIHKKFTYSERSSKKMQQIREAYNRGLHENMKRENSLTRCAIYIYGSGNLGKTTNAIAALNSLDLDYLLCPRGSGKYDSVDSTTDALVFDDNFVSDVLTVSDNKKAILHRRNKDDRPWLGTYVVITNNMPPLEYFCKCLGIELTWVSYDKSQDKYSDNAGSGLGKWVIKNPADKEVYNAVISRFYIYHMTDNGLELEHKVDRGQVASRYAHEQMIAPFNLMFMINYKNYQIHQNEMHIPDIVDDLLPLKDDIKALNQKYIDLDRQYTDNFKTIMAKRRELENAYVSEEHAFKKTSTRLIHNYHDCASDLDHLGRVLDSFSLNWIGTLQRETMSYSSQYANKYELLVDYLTAKFKKHIAIMQSSLLVNIYGSAGDIRKQLAMDIEMLHENPSDFNQAVKKYEKQLKYNNSRSNDVISIH